MNQQLIESLDEREKNVLCGLMEVGVEIKPKERDCWRKFLGVGPKLIAKLYLHGLVIDSPRPPGLSTRARGVIENCVGRSFDRGMVLEAIQDGRLSTKSRNCGAKTLNHIIKWALSDAVQIEAANHAADATSHIGCGCAADQEVKSDAKIPPAKRKPDRLPQDEVDAIRRNPPQILDIREVAAYLGCSVRKVRNDIAERRLTIIRLGGSVRVRLSDIHKALEASAVRAI